MAETFARVECAICKFTVRSYEMTDSELTNHLKREGWGKKAHGLICNTCNKFVAIA